MTTNQPPQPAPKPKKPWYLRWWAITIAVVIVLGVIGNLLGDDPTAATPAAPPAKTSTPAAPETTPVEPEPEVTPTETEPAEEPEVSSEFRAALKSAEDYLAFMPFSKAGLLDQLTSEHGSQFPKDAAEYAVENVEVDWKEQALLAAIQYRETMSMSKKAIHDQLTSEYGERFTKKQADYAIANLPD